MRSRWADVNVSGLWDVGGVERWRDGGRRMVGGWLGFGVGGGCRHCRVRLVRLTVQTEQSCTGHHCTAH